VVGVLALVSGFWLGLGCEVGGVWWVAVPVWRVPVPGWRGGWCGVLGAVPLRPLLNSPLRAAWCAVVPGSGRPPVGRWLLFLGGRLAGCSSFLGGWAGLVGGLSCWLCSCLVVLQLGSWLRFSLVTEVRPWDCWGCAVVAGSVGCVRVGGLFFYWLCCSRWAGRPGRSGSSSPPLSPPLYTTEPPGPPDSMRELTR
jgi:hypothetical protein